MYATNGALSNSIGFEVLAEGPTTPTNGFAQEVPDTASAAWRGKDRVVVTTVGYQDCPVLPASITISKGVASINLAVVARDLTCGPPWSPIQPSFA